MEEKPREDDTMQVPLRLQRFWKRPVWKVLAAAAGTALLVDLVAGLPLNVASLVHPVINDVLAAESLQQFSGYHVETTKHFSILYTDSDAQFLAGIAAAAERAADFVDREFAYHPGRPIAFIVYPTRESMQQSFGWNHGESALGVYYGGTIRILSPRLWLVPTGRGLAEDLFLQGPFVHEYTHEVLDQKLDGNFPRWYTEGMAQYEEYKATGYLWLPEEGKWNQPLYTFDELTARFDDLDNQALAYHESVSMIAYLIQTGGMARQFELQRRLAAHISFDQAFRDTYGETQEQAERQWRQWLKHHPVL
jgi:hypothetical protein